MRFQRRSEFLKSPGTGSLVNPTLYRKAREIPGLLRKMGRATLIDLDAVNRYEAALPVMAACPVAPPVAVPAKPVKQAKHLLHRLPSKRARQSVGKC